MGKDDTRNHILDTAIELFWSKSYHGMNMNELSREAGVNKATVYQYFASKEELAVAAIQRTSDRTEEYVYQSTFGDTDNAKERLENIYQKVFQIHDGVHRSHGKCRGCPFVNIGVELSTSNEVIRAAINKAFGVLRQYYGEIIDTHLQDGELPRGFDRGETISALQANMNSCLVASKLENRPEAVLDGQKRALQFLAM